jgi:N-hydroxyarylamine O-acetyltransferase
VKAGDVDLAAYFERIGVTLASPPDLAALRALHRAHVCAIPFENLDLQMGLSIDLDIGNLQARLVARRRGGYCFQQNTLFLHVLRSLGFDVMPCEARVRHGAGEVLGRTHMLLVCRLDQRAWLCDVGFGGTGLFEPAPLDGEVVTQFGWTYRVASEGPLYVLQSLRPTGWGDLYAFEPVERYGVDFEMANWFTSTWPQSRFVLTLTAQRSTPEVRYILRNLAFTEERVASVETRSIARAELMPLLRDTFGLDVPLDARFRALD